MTAQVLRLSNKKRALSDAHREHLRGSGLDDESIEGNGFYTERTPTELAGLLNWKSYGKGRGDALVIPFFLPGASEPFFSRVRPDQPRTNERTGKVIKYEQPKDTAVAPYFPVRSRTKAWYDDPARALVFTEGEKKAALLDQLGYAAIGSTGVSCFHDAAHRRDTDAYRLHELIRKHVKIEARRCVIAFDSDAADNADVMRAARILAGMLTTERAGAVLFAVIPPADGAKLGIDDYAVRFGADAARELINAAEPIEPLANEEHGLLKSYKRILDGAPIAENLRMPRGYDLQLDGLYRNQGEDKSEHVERAPILVRRQVADLYSGHEHVELVFKRNKQWRTVLVPRRAIADSRAALNELAPLGAPVDSNTSAGVVRWLRDFESANETRLPRATSVGRCGWHRVGNEDVFVVGEVMRRETSTIELVVDKHQERGRLARALHTSGTLEEHLAALRAAWDASPIAAAMICGALAAPMIKPLKSPLFAMHLAGDSSRGKSTMLRIAASVYGNPRDDEWVTSWNATTVGHEQRAAYFCDLPLAIDEAGTVDAKDREKAVYMLVNGVGRTRGAKEGGLRETQAWRTIVLSTGEHLLAEESAATGAQVRTIQFHVDGFGELAAVGVDGLSRAVSEHYGHVGAEWIGSLLECDESDWDAHRASARATARALQATAPSSSLRARQAGFWALLAYTEAVAHATLGIGAEGGATMHALFASKSDSHVEVRTAADRAIELVREWLIRAPTSFPRLVMSQEGKKVPKGESQAREVCGYLDEDAAYFIPGSLKTYLAGHGISDGVVLRAWRARGWLRVHPSEPERLTLKVRVGGKVTRVLALTAEAAELDTEQGSQFPAKAGSGTPAGNDLSW